MGDLTTALELAALEATDPLVKEWLLALLDGDTAASVEHPAAAAG
jgi:hypothetical protein